MHYKLLVEESFSPEQIELFWQKLYQIIESHNNIDFKKNPDPFIEEGNSVVLLNASWGVNRPDSYDIEELSEAFPEVTFVVLQASNILNGRHFEDLSNYSRTEYRDGSMRRILKPKPVEWEIVKEFQSLNPWG